MMELNSKVQVLLREKLFSATLEEVVRPQNLSYVLEEGMELIEYIGTCGLKNTDNPDQIKACGDMFIYIAQNFNPKLAVLSFLEQIEIFATSPKISVFIEPIAIILSRITVKRASSYAWVLSTFNALLDKFPKSSNLSSTSLSVLEYYKVLCTLYESVTARVFPRGISRFIQDGISETNANMIRGSRSENEMNETMKLGDIIRDHLIEILGEPFIYYDLHFSDDSTDNVKSEARIIAERIMDVISKVSISSNLIMRRTIEGEIHVKNSGDEQEIDGVADEDIHKYLQSVSLTQRAVGNYFYLIFIQNLAENQIISATESEPKFRFKACLTLSLALMEDSVQIENSTFAFKKGIELANDALTRMGPPIPYDIGDYSDFFPFLEKLTQLVALCSDKQTRKLSIDLLRKFTTFSDPQWRCKLIEWVFETTKHDSLYGYFVTMLKDFVKIALDEKDPEMMVEFCGPKLCFMLNKICHFKIIDKSFPGMELLQENDRFISTLNFIRFLYIRDGKFNQSGFQCAMNKITEEYLKPLKSAVDLSLLQFQHRANVLRKGLQNQEQQEDIEESSVMIDGVEMFPKDIPVPEQLESLQSSIFTFGLMSDLLDRVEECRCTSTPGLNSKTTKK